jgi:hypothetical protein
MENIDKMEELLAPENYTDDIMKKSMQATKVDKRTVSSKTNAQKAREAKLLKLQEKKKMFEIAKRHLHEERKKKAAEYYLSDDSSEEEEIIYINPKKQTVKKTRVQRGAGTPQVATHQVEDVSKKIELLMNEISELKKKSVPIVPIEEPKAIPASTTQVQSNYSYPNVRKIDSVISDHMRERILKWN